MSKTIAINAGSSSLKWQLYQMPEEIVLGKGLIERIGHDDAISTVKFDGRSEKQVLPIPNHEVAVKILLDDLIRFELINDYKEITGVGHRVVAGGTEFTESVLLDEETIEKIDALSVLAPLHNPANVQGMRAFKAILPDITSVAVFDTAYHTTLPEVAARYPLPTELVEKYKIRKYGAHGTSHQYVAQEAAKILGKPLEELKLITAHIGNGVSITAISEGKSIDTSMGFTPLAGPMMGTRSGDIDPAILPYLMTNAPEYNNAEALTELLNRKSGLLAVSEKSNDMREIEEDVINGVPKSTLAFKIFVDRIKKYIAQYFGVLNGADALIFTAGIGENDVTTRREIVEGLSWFGMDIIPEKNTRGCSGIISTENAKVKVIVVPTDEELVIARDVERLKK